MPISIKNTHAERLAREVAKKTGESMTQAIIKALEERFERLTGRSTIPDVASEIMRVSERCASLPDIDKRSADEILGYGADGTFEDR